MAATTSQSTRFEFKSINEALAKLEPGDALVLNADVYRAAIDLRLAPSITAASATKPILIAGPKANVSGPMAIVKGSDIVTDWESLGSDLYVKRSWETNSQQVYVGGEALQQIGGTIWGGYPVKPIPALADLYAFEGGVWPGRVSGGISTMPDKSFYYDETNRALYVRFGGADLNRQMVEVSTRPYLVFGDGLKYVTIQDITFQHSNTSSVPPAGGAVNLIGDHITVQRIRIEQGDLACMTFWGNDNVVQESSFEYCGQLGLAGSGARNRITGNVFAHNNTRGFNIYWEAGGAKFVGAGGLASSEVSGNIASLNNGTGIWFDWGNTDNIISKNITAYNAGEGIHYEASMNAAIIDNYSYGNRLRGIYVASSSETAVAHNLVLANAMGQIVVVDEGRKDPSGRLDLNARNNRVIGNVFVKNGNLALVLPSGANGNVSDTNLYLDDASRNIFSVNWSGTIIGLSAWQAKTDNDMASWQKPVSLSTAITQRLASQTLIDDLGEIDRVRSGYTVPTTSYQRLNIDPGSRSKVLGPQ